jgi:hypothetical protein
MVQPKDEYDDEIRPYAATRCDVVVLSSVS